MRSFLESFFEKPIFYLAILSTGLIIVVAVLIGMKSLLQAIFPNGWPRLTLILHRIKKGYRESATAKLLSRDRHNKGAGSGSGDRIGSDEKKIRELIEFFLQKEFGLENIQSMFKEIPKIQKDIASLAEEHKKQGIALQRMDDIYARLNQIEQELSTVPQLLGQEQEQERQTYKVPERTHIPHVTPRRADRAGSWEEAPRELLNLYNAGVIDPGNRDTFQTRYQPTRIKTANAMQRRRDPNLLPEFQTADDGDYYAVEIKQHGQRRCAVLPRFDLTLGEVSYGPGGMGEVFHCPGYDPRLQYQRVKVVRPAIFEPDGDQNWHCVGNGELDLGKGE